MEGLHDIEYNHGDHKEDVYTQAPDEALQTGSKWAQSEARWYRYGAVTMHAVPLERSAHSIQTIL